MLTNTSSFRRVAEIGAIAGILLAFALLPSLPPIPLCPIRFFTGRECPTCGTTRAVWLLLHGQFCRSWQMNPIGCIVVIAAMRRVLALSGTLRAKTMALIERYSEIPLLAGFLVAGIYRGCLHLASTVLR